jgi:hypothetical protein
LGGVIGGAFTSAWEWAKRAVIDGINTVVSWISSVPGRIGAFAGQMFSAGQRLITALFDGLKRVGGFVSDVASAIVDGVKSALNWVIGRLNAGIRAVWPGVFGAAPQIPGLADGAIVTHRMVAEIGEAGPEVVIPLTRPRRAVELAQQSGLVRLLADRRVLGPTAQSPKASRTTTVNAPITVTPLAANPEIVARLAADHIAAMAQA